jgi:hypothetical protein
VSRIVEARLMRRKENVGSRRLKTLNQANTRDCNTIVLFLSTSSKYPMDITSSILELQWFRDILRRNWGVTLDKGCQFGMPKLNSYCLCSDRLF